MMPLGATDQFNNIDANGNPTAAITNRLVNFGWEYVYHCHILSHEEMDMMRPVSYAVPPYTPDGLAGVIDSPTSLTFYWNDTSISETSFVLQKSADGTIWTDVTTVDSPLDVANTHGTRTYLDSAFDVASPLYRVVAKNPVGYGGDFMSLTVQSVSATVTAGSAACTHHHRPEADRRHDRWRHHGDHHGHQLRRHAAPQMQSPLTASTPPTPSTRPPRSQRSRRRTAWARCRCR